MTQPPLLSKQISGLLKLSGQDRIDIPLTAAGQEVLMVKLISDCLGSGSTWAQIGTVLIGTPDAKRAKRISKRLAKDAQRQMLRKSDG
jgi:hypothetical protein